MGDWTVTFNLAADERANADNIAAFFDDAMAEASHRELEDPVSGWDGIIGDAKVNQAPNALELQVLDSIQEMLRDPDWGVGMLEDIAEMIQLTGRSTENYPDDRSTWARH